MRPPTRALRDATGSGASSGRRSDRDRGFCQFLLRLGGTSTHAGAPLRAVCAAARARFRDRRQTPRSEQDNGLREVVRALAAKSPHRRERPAAPVFWLRSLFRWSSRFWNEASQAMMFRAWCGATKDKYASADIRSRYDLLQRWRSRPVELPFPRGLPPFCLPAAETPATKKLCEAGDGSFPAVGSRRCDRRNIRAESKRRFCGSDEPQYRSTRRRWWA